MYNSSTQWAISLVAKASRLHRDHGSSILSSPTSKKLSFLEVHHKDCDRNNNCISNLEILCPTCHVAEHYNSKTGKFNKNNGLVVEQQTR